MPFKHLTLAPKQLTELGKVSPSSSGDARRVMIGRSLTSTTGVRGGGERITTISEASSTFDADFTRFACAAVRCDTGSFFISEKAEAIKPPCDVVDSLVLQLKNHLRTPETTRPQFK